MTETTTIEAERERMGQLYQRSKRRKKNVIIKQSDKKYFIIHERDWKQFVLAATLCADPTKNNNNNNSTTSNKQPQQQQPKDIKWNLKHICTYTVSRREEKKEVGSIHWVRARTIGISTANRLKYPLKAIWCVFMCVAVSAFFVVSLQVNVRAVNVILVLLFLCHRYSTQHIYRILYWINI